MFHVTPIDRLDGNCGRLCELNDRKIKTIQVNVDVDLESSTCLAPETSLKAKEVVMPGQNIHCRRAERLEGTIAMVRRPCRLAEVQ